MKVCNLSLCFIAMAVIFKNLIRWRGKNNRFYISQWNVQLAKVYVNITMNLSEWVLQARPNMEPFKTKIKGILL